jgi:hypothetical protein
VPEELKKVSQQDITFIAEFLQRFENNNSSSNAEERILNNVCHWQFFSDFQFVTPIEITI